MTSSEPDDSAEARQDGGDATTGAREGRAPELRPTETPEVVEAELVDEVRALRDVLRATIDYNISGQSGLTPSQIGAIDAASPDLREVIVRHYDKAMSTETENSRRLTELTVKDQGDSVALARLGLMILAGIVAALIALAGIALFVGEPGVAAAALGPIAVAAIGGVIRMAVRGRGDEKESR